MTETRVCRHCLAAFPATPQYFYRDMFSTGRIKLGYICKPCKSAQTAERTKARQEGRHGPIKIKGCAHYAILPMDGSVGLVSWGGR